MKAIPGINLAASVINAVIAASIIAALGEGSVYIFEQIYLGNKTVEDIDWVKKVMDARFTNQFVEKVKDVFGNLSPGTDRSVWIKTILDLFINKKDEK